MHAEWTVKDKSLRLIQALIKAFQVPMVGKELAAEEAAHTLSGRT